MRRLEPASGWRIVADPAALDLLAQKEGVFLLRFAADDAFVLSVEPGPWEKIGVPVPVRDVPPGTPIDYSGRPLLFVNDEHAIMARDLGWSLAIYSHEEFDAHIRPLIDWHVPTDRLGQGLVAGVPAKVLIEEYDVLLLCPTAYAHELSERLRA